MKGVGRLSHCGDSDAFCELFGLKEKGIFKYCVHSVLLNI